MNGIPPTETTTTTRNFWTMYRLSSNKGREAIDLYFAKHKIGFIIQDTIVIHDVTKYERFMHTFYPLWLEGKTPQEFDKNIREMYTPPTDWNPKQNPFTEEVIQEIMEEHLSKLSNDLSNHRIF